MSNNKTKKQLDILNGSILDKIVLFALPIALSSALQQLFNSADSAVVGRFSGHEALAAVGVNGPIVALFINLFVGVSVGANVVISTLIGSKQYDRIKNVVGTCILGSLLAGLLLAVFGQFIAKPLLVLMSTPEETLNQAILYLRIYFVAMPFILLYNFGAAILRSDGDTKRPLYALFASGVINLVLNLILVIIFRLGVIGVAVATLVSNIFSSSLVFYWLVKEEGYIHLDVKQLRIDKISFDKVIAIGLPAGIQGAVFSISNIFIQSFINSFGQYAIAGNTATLNFETLANFVGSSFSQAVVTFSSQNFAAGNIERCKKVVKYCFILELATYVVIGSLFNLFADNILQIITEEPAVIEQAKIRMEIAVLFLFLAAGYEVFGAALRAIGHSLLPALVVVFGTCVFRLVWLFTVFPFHHENIAMIYILYPITWAITSVVTIIFYYKITRREFKYHD